MTLLWRLCALLVGSSVLFIAAARAVPAVLDGSGLVAYVTDWDIYLLDVTHRLTQNLTHYPREDWTPSWSPQGQRLAFRSSRRGSSAIYVLDWVSQSLERLPSESDEDTDPAWSPDGHSLAFTARTKKRTDVMIVDFARGETRNLTAALPGSHSSPVWSPDSRTLAFISNDRSRQIQLYDFNSATLMVASDDPADAGIPVWSPDARTLAFTSRRSGRRSHIFAVDVATNQLRDLTADQPGNHSNPVWSPDGRYLAYNTRHPQQIITLLDLTTGSRRPLVDFVGSYRDPVWLPDSQHLVFVGGNNELYLTDVERGQPQPLVQHTTAIVNNPIWLLLY
ncbi:MAG: hypothetical protein K8L99_29725 [Anaerolineae bacterium]|nr:hypothetical protein [Anaerolineae bacterium]